MLVRTFALLVVLGVGGAAASRIDDRTGWEEFLATCEQLSAELSRRYEEAIDVSFEDEIAFTKDVLASWDELQESLPHGQQNRSSG